MPEASPTVTAGCFLSYFESVHRGYPGEHWVNGAEMSRRWLELLAGQPTQAEIDAFVARLEAEPNLGSGWFDLGLQFRRWARRVGYRA